MTETLQRIEVFKYYHIIETHPNLEKLVGSQIFADQGSISNARLYDTVESAQKAARSLESTAKTIEIHAYSATLTPEERAQLSEGLPLSSKIDSTQIDLVHIGLRASIIRK